MTEKTQQLILIVDDDALDRGMMKMLLSRLPETPYLCIEAGTFDKALELCRRQTPDCLLLDYSMPDMDGIIFLKKLRHEGYQDIPVILVSAAGSETLAVHAFKTGVQDYLRKDKLSSDILAHAIKFAVYQKETERALLQRDMDLQAKNDELLHFNYRVSHDLKSPLVTIKTFLDHLVKDMTDGDKDRVAQDLFYIHSAAEKMVALLDELLQLSRIGRVANPYVEAPLQDIVREALVLVAGRIDERGARVTVTEKPVLLYGDRVRLVEVFQNLVDNAVKFMGEQKEPLVEIGAEKKNGDIVCFVRDNGMGIDPRYRDKLFGLFEKLNSGMEGSGIGLALVKRIIEVHGGKIWAESAGIGKGACFWFSLPGKQIQDSGFKIQD